MEKLEICVPNIMTSICVTGRREGGGKGRGEHAKQAYRAETEDGFGEFQDYQLNYNRLGRLAMLIR